MARRAEASERVPDELPDRVPLELLGREDRADPDFFSPESEARADFRAAGRVPLDDAGLACRAGLVGFAGFGAEAAWASALRCASSRSFMLGPERFFLAGSSGASDASDAFGAAACSGAGFRAGMRGGCSPVALAGAALAGGALAGAASDWTGPISTTPLHFWHFALSALNVAGTLKRAPQSEQVPRRYSIRVFSLGLGARWACAGGDRGDSSF